MISVIVSTIKQFPLNQLMYENRRPLDATVAARLKSVWRLALTDERSKMAGRIAVKVNNQQGDEVMKMFKVQ